MPFGVKNTKKGWQKNEPASKMTGKISQLESSCSCKIKVHLMIWCWKKTRQWMRKLRQREWKKPNKTQKMRRKKKTNSSMIGHFTTLMLSRMKTLILIEQNRPVSQKMLRWV